MKIGVVWAWYPILFLPGLSLMLIVASFLKRLTALYLTTLILVIICLLGLAVESIQYPFAGGPWFTYWHMVPVLIGWGAVVLSIVFKTSPRGAEARDGVKKASRGTH